MIAIRADANNEIATGHIMRCLAIADRLKQKKKEVIFIVADNSAEALIVAKGYTYICLNTVWNDMDTETDKLLKVIKENDIDTLLIDSYFVTKDYLEKIGKIVRTFYIDDLNMFEYPVDTVINYSVYADKFDYENRYRNLGMQTKFLLGCQYTPLRTEFQNVIYSVNKTVSNILITTGGTDNFNIAGNLAIELVNSKKLENIKFHIVVGAYNKNKDKLETLAAKHNNIILHYNVKEMAKLMTSCDIVVSAGGTTLYEVCACGIPTIAVSFADNQFDNVTRFAQEKLLYYVGDVRNDMDNVLEKVKISVEDMLCDYDIRNAMSKRMKNKGISNGADKIAEKLISE